MAKAKKYKVTANDQFLGHYHAKSPQEAVEKGKAAHIAYHAELIASDDTVYTAQKGSMNPAYKLTFDGKVIE